ncbi:type VII secretion protein EssB [Sporolactobacillus terrae]|uniref:ESX secretion system protein YukC n=1 Tax=Sporolactobacillus terrae TaxID=269673 RepID=A0A5K7WZQ1_9BACL|nr:type VII secretion protein EssB [Sporolactobacillus terrae]BBO00162.1 ESX secretion system protein YukC [Sporolactobacillus terrae]
MALSNSFFQSKFEADAAVKDGYYQLTFQRAKVPLRHEDELGVLQSINDGVARTVETTEDEIVIQFGEINELRPFSELHAEVITEKMIFASNLIHFFAGYRPSRLIPVCFPENLFFTPGFQPVFLHYGVKDSFPPLSYGQEEALQQVKAVLAVLFDASNDFDTYVKFNFAIKTTRFVKDLFRCATFEKLAALIDKERRKEIAKEKESIRLPKMRNRLRNGAMIGSIVVLIPLIILTIYAFIIQLPRENLFQQSHEAFLENRYSDVATRLSSVAYSKMPKVVRYELAISYVKNEALTDEQQNTILNDLTLQSNQHYYQYWIQVGRGDASGALDTARSINDRSLIAYALIKEKAAIQEDLSMNGKQKQERLQSIDAELKDYSDQLKNVQGGESDQNPDVNAAQDQQKANPAQSEKDTDGSSAQQDKDSKDATKK